MPMDFMDKQQMMEKLYDDYFENREWWVFLTPHNTNSFMIEIEDKYFSGSNGKYFHAIMYFPYGAIYMAKKSHITRKQINQVFHNMSKSPDVPNANTGDCFLMTMEDSDKEHDQMFYEDVMYGLQDVLQIRNGK